MILDLWHPASDSLLQRDMLMWCMEEALRRSNSEDNDVENLALRILMVNFGAIHTTSMVGLG